MTPPSYQKGVCKSVGFVNHYHNMWARFSHKLETFTKLMTSKVNLNEPK